jgi:hypothetical protein
VWKIVWLDNCVRLAYPKVECSWELPLRKFGDEEERADGVAKELGEAQVHVRSIDHVRTTVSRLYFIQRQWTMVKAASMAWTM